MFIGISGPCDGDYGAQVSLVNTPFRMTYGNVRTTLTR